MTPVPSFLKEGIYSDILFVKPTFWPTGDSLAGTEEHSEQQSVCIKSKIRGREVSRHHGMNNPDFRDCLLPFNTMRFERTKGWEGRRGVRRGTYVVFSTWVKSVVTF